MFRDRSPADPTESPYQNHPMYYNVQLEDAGRELLHAADFLGASSLYASMADEAAAMKDKPAHLDLLKMSEYCLHCQVNAYQSVLTSVERQDIDKKISFMQERISIESDTTGNALVPSTPPPSSHKRLDEVLKTSLKDRYSDLKLQELFTGMRANGSRRLLSGLSYGTQIIEYQYGILSDNNDVEGRKDRMALGYISEGLRLLDVASPDMFVEPTDRASCAKQILDGISRYLSNTESRSRYSKGGNPPSEKLVNELVSMSYHLFDILDQRSEGKQASYIAMHAYSKIATTPSAMLTKELLSLQQEAVKRYLDIADEVTDGKDMSERGYQSFYANALGMYGRLYTRGNQAALTAARLAIVSRPDTDWSLTLPNTILYGTSDERGVNNRSAEFLSGLIGTLPLNEQPEVIEQLIEREIHPTETIGLFRAFVSDGGKASALTQRCLLEIAIAAAQNNTPKLTMEVSGYLKNASSVAYLMNLVK